MREAYDSRPLRETNRARFNATRNNTLVKTDIPSFTSFKVNRRTDDIKLERHTDDLKRARQTDELKPRKQRRRARTERQLFVNELVEPEFIPAPQKKAIPKTRRRGRKTVAQNSTRQRSPDFRKWREQSSKELEKVSKGNHGIFLLLILILDVFGIPAAILGWSSSVVLAGLAFCISLPVFAYGTVNIYNEAAIPLALVFGGAWGVIIHRYVSWHIFIIISIFAFIVCIHFFLFRRHVR